MNITVVGGAGHVGLPLSIALADVSEKIRLTILDINQEVLDKINQGTMPFLEKGAEEKLKNIINRNLFTSVNSNVLTQSDVIIIVIGTPVDEHLNPLFSVFNKLLEQLLPYLKSDQTIILRSTLYPGTSQKVFNLFHEKYKINIHVAYCPERIAEGKAMEELYSLPQIISGFSEKALTIAKEVFGLLTNDIIELSPMEAELAKLFTNSWRYIQFATANQFYMLAEEKGLDFYKIYHAVTHNYPRANGFPKAGFSAGPCLFKDTMQLSAFSNNQFFLGHSAMLINEGLPYFVVQQIKKRYDISKMTVGILGMSFKGESDDNRSSLSYKLKKILEIEAGNVICTDEYVFDTQLKPLEEVLMNSDLLILGAPHKKYREISTNKIVIDIWKWMDSLGC